jgi:DNA-binding PadR family transcriptional regulator
MRDQLLGYLVLALIAAREEGVHGYRLRVEFEALYGECWPVSHARLYRVLSILEASGYLSRREERPSSRPTRKVYDVTDRGLDRLRSWLATPPTSHSGFLADEVSAKLLLADPDDVDTIAAIVRQHRDVCLARLDLAARKQRVLRKTAIDDRIAALILDGAEARVRTELAWLERIERSVVRDFA